MIRLVTLAGLLAAGMTLGTAVPASATATSPTWAGYVVSGGNIRAVSAEWTVPAGACDGSRAQAAFWVGIDDSATIEQVGTTLDCDSSGAHATAWYQMYPRAAVRLATISAGDDVYASVSYLGSDLYVVTFVDLSQGWTRVVRSVASAANATAEVIAEASDGPLADFGTVTFRQSRVNGRPLAAYEPDPWLMWSGSLVMASASSLHTDRFSVMWWYR
jgi:Peptidase A4 family